MLRKKLLPYMTPFFHDQFFNMNYTFESRKEIIAIHDNCWRSLPVEWYTARLNFWFQINFYTFMEFFPYKQLRPYMVQKYNRKEIIIQQQLKNVKNQIESRLKGFHGSEIKLDKKIIEQTLKEMNKIYGVEQSIKNYKLGEKYDVSKMGFQRLEQFLLELKPLYAPREFYVQNLENLVPIQYVRKCPSAEKFEQVLKGWRGDRFEVVLTQ
eukprot:TRINITY_DN9570_c0_g1_i1.p2 TRINITY_DN9570_c0_g1~~TRINITY_DN9570_c0_g1_i1.p2  ORF type:complete len:210 (-),score=24.35 TRINITY_DN9570_c0_g1_i1:435-1064(-)